LRIDRDEQRLNLLRERTELSHCSGDVTESRRANIRAMCVSEKDQQPLAAEVLIRDLVSALRVEQIEPAGECWRVRLMQPKDRYDRYREHKHTQERTQRKS